ncbi:hypothetical protein AMTR_s00166p00019440 [Amborella trichopoda]|uniref:Uncharacterized protein n=1 Tax=Amborella trichopoda TaxID=13333 RepID=W1PS21_AMBTC|nr:hypothetical protein AMTR_s00166p00019440 [Amborella trichopoda]
MKHFNWKGPDVSSMGTKALPKIQWQNTKVILAIHKGDLKDQKSDVIPSVPVQIAPSPGPPFLSYSNPKPGSSVNAVSSISINTSLYASTWKARIDISDVDKAQGC